MAKRGASARAAQARRDTERVSTAHARASATSGCRSPDRRSLLRRGAAQPPASFAPVRSPRDEVPGVPTSNAFPARGARRDRPPRRARARRRRRRLRPRRLHESQDCVSGNRAKATVTGDNIDSVRFFVDGKLVKTVTEATQSGHLRVLDAVRAPERRRPPRPCGRERVRRTRRCASRSRARGRPRRSSRVEAQGPRPAVLAAIVSIAAGAPAGRPAARVRRGSRTRPRSRAGRTPPPAPGVRAAGGAGAPRRPPAPADRGRLPRGVRPARQPAGRRRRTWVQLRLPQRPNNVTGWVRRDTLGSFHLVHTRLVVNRRALRVTLYKRGKRRFRARIGMGAPGTPTPAGLVLDPREVPRQRQPAVRHASDGDRCVLRRADRLAGRRRDRPPRDQRARAHPGPAVARLHPAQATRHRAALRAHADRHAAAHPLTP